MIDIKENYARKIFSVAKNPKSYVKTIVSKGMAGLDEVVDEFEDIIKKLGLSSEIKFNNPEVHVTCDHVELASVKRDSPLVPTCKKSPVGSLAKKFKNYRDRVGVGGLDNLCPNQYGNDDPKEELGYGKSDDILFQTQFYYTKCPDYTIGIHSSFSSEYDEYNRKNLLHPKGSTGGLTVGQGLGSVENGIIIINKHYFLGSGKVPEHVAISFVEVFFHELLHIIQMKVVNPEFNSKLKGLIRSDIPFSNGIEVILFTSSELSAYSLSVALGIFLSNEYTLPLFETRVKEARKIAKRVTLRAKGDSHGWYDLRKEGAKILKTAHSLQGLTTSELSKSICSAYLRGLLNIFIIVELLNKDDIEHIVSIFEGAGKGDLEYFKRVEKSLKLIRKYCKELDKFNI